jgi:hypothetical protein
VPAGLPAADEPAGMPPADVPAAVPTAAMAAPAPQVVPPPEDTPIRSWLKEKLHMGGGQ